MQIDLADLAAMVTYQLGALDGIARAAGHRMTHMSFHGALGNMVAADATMAAPLVGAVAAFDPGITIISSTSRAIETAAAERGLRVVTTFLADRAYDDDGLLVPRRLPGCGDSRRGDGAGPGTAHAQRRRGGNPQRQELAMRPRSILVHGDTAGAVGLARRCGARSNRPAAGSCRFPGRGAEAA